MLKMESVLKLIFDSILSNLKDENKKIINLIEKIDNSNIKIKEDSFNQFMLEKDFFETNFKKEVQYSNPSDAEPEAINLEIIDDLITIQIKYPIKNIHYIMVKFLKNTTIDNNNFKLEMSNFYLLNKPRGSILNLNTNYNISMFNEQLKEKPCSRFHYNELKNNGNNLTTFFGFNISQKNAIHILKNMHIENFNDFNDFLILSSDLNIKDNEHLTPFHYLHSEIHQYEYQYLKNKLTPK